MNILISDIPREGILRLVMDDQKSGNALSENMMSRLMEKIKKASTSSILIVKGPRRANQRMRQTMRAKRLITPVNTWESMLPEVKTRRNNPWLIAGLVKWYNGSFVMISWEFDPLIQHHLESQSNVFRQNEKLVVKTWASWLSVFLCKRITLDCSALVWCDPFLA